MLIGRTFAYSDTQRFRVGANYLQLPINRPNVPVRTHQRDGQMAPHVDDAGSPHVNYEPSSTGSIVEAPRQYASDHHPFVQGRVMRHGITRTQQDYAAAGERYRTLEDWEREDLLDNLAGDMKACPEPIALRMIWHFYHCDEGYGTEVARRAGMDLQKALALPPLEKHPGPGKARELRIKSDGVSGNGEAAAAPEFQEARRSQ